MAYDLVLKDGLIVDGTGGPGFHADVAVTNGRIVDIGKLTGKAKRVIDADGLVVTPGIIDVHTHYDAQLCWDGTLSSSAAHGTTTVIQGNCGIGVAPCKPKDREIAMQDLVVLEGISYDVMNAGIDWQFETFSEYLNFARRRGIGINVAPFIPLSPMRRYVMGESSIERGANDDERAQIAQLIKQYMKDGALGFSATMVRRQVGYQGKPMPCQLTDEQEMRAYGNVLRDLGRGAMQFNVVDSLGRPTDEELALLDILLDASGGRTVTYSGAMYRNDDPEAIDRMLVKVEGLRKRGAIPQSTIMPVTIEVDFHSPMVFGDVQAFKSVFNKPYDEQVAIYRDPDWRNRALTELRNSRKLFGSSWEESVVLRFKDQKMSSLLGKSVVEIAKERGTEPFNTMIDVALEDNLDVKFLGDLVNTNMDHLRHHIKDPRILLGLHDGGAHIDMMFQAGFPTYMLGTWVRDQKAITLEHAIQRMTSEPADYFGFADRGRIQVGKAGDFAVFDPETVGSPQRPDQVLHDLPGGGIRLFAKPRGVEYVVVNGTTLYEHGQYTGALPGQIVSAQ